MTRYTYSTDKTVRVSQDGFYPRSIQKLESDKWCHCGTMYEGHGGSKYTCRNFGSKTIRGLLDKIEGER